MFTLSTSIDTSKEKLFLLKCSGLEGRFDPEYYRPRHYRDLELLYNSPYKSVALGEVCERIVDGPFGSAIKANDYVQKGIPFIRVADVTRGEGTIKTTSMIYISEEAHERILRSQVVPGDVVIAKTGATMGAASVIPATIEEANIRGDLGALTASKEILPEYIIAFINTGIGQRLFWRLNSGGTRGRVVIGNLKKYPLVVPPLEVQERIIEIMNIAYSTKKRKTAKADEIKKQIDTYLLGELGLCDPTDKYTNEKNEVFKINASDINYKRLDPEYYKPSFLMLSDSIKESDFPLVSLKEVTDNILSGSTPAKSEYSKEKTENPILKVGSYKNDYIKLDKCDYTNIKASKFIKANDIFVLSAAHQSSYVGRFIKILKQEPEIPTSFVGELICIRANKDVCEPMYLYTLLNTELFKLLLNREKTGQTSHIYPKDIQNILIPLPKMDTQRVIVRQILDLRSQIEVLLMEANECLSKAKKDVEVMMLGGL
jgi:type I restriction enzyme M protein